MNGGLRPFYKPTARRGTERSFGGVRGPLPVKTTLLKVRMEPEPNSGARGTARPPESLQPDYPAPKPLRRISWASSAPGISKRGDTRHPQGTTMQPNLVLPRLVQNIHVPFCCSSLLEAYYSSRTHKGWKLPAP